MYMCRYIFVCACVLKYFACVLTCRVQPQKACEFNFNTLRELRIQLARWQWPFVARQTTTTSSWFIINDIRVYIFLYVYCLLNVYFLFYFYFYLLSSYEHFPTSFDL